MRRHQQARQFFDLSLQMSLSKIFRAHISMSLSKIFRAHIKIFRAHISLLCCNIPCSHLSTMLLRGTDNTSLISTLLGDTEKHCSVTPEKHCSVTPKSRHSSHLSTTLL